MSFLLERIAQSVLFYGVSEMNKKIKSYVAVASICGLTMTMTTVKADVALCQMAINAAELATQGTEFLGRQADKGEATLLAKLASAELKVADGKYADAVAKLADYQATVISMADAAKPKMAATDAYGIDGIADGIGGLDGNAADAIAACSL